MTRTSTPKGTKAKRWTVKVKAKRKLPPDPEGMNRQRAAYARKAIEYYRRLVVTDRQDAIGDLISDLAHLCDRDPRYGVFESGLERGLQHYEEETLPDHLYATTGGVSH